MQLDLAKLEKELDSTLKTLWVDRMEINVRGDLPIALLRFFSVVPPDKLSEACRMQTSLTHLQAIVDSLSRTLNYYPTKPSVPVAQS